MSSVSQPNWLALPKDIAVEIFQYLEPGDIYRAGGACKTWLDISNIPQSWMPWIKKYFPDIASDTGIANIKNLCKQIVVKRDNLSRDICSVTYLPTDPNNHHLPIGSNFEWDLGGLGRFPHPSRQCMIGTPPNSIKVTLTEMGRCLSINNQTLVSNRHYSCIYSKDNILFFGTDNKICKWVFNDLPEANPTIKRSFLGHTDLVRCLGSWANCLISGSYDSTIRLWDIGTSSCTDILEGHAAAVTSLLVVEDLLFSGDDLGNIKIWDLKDKKCIDTYESNNDLTNCSVTSPMFDRPFLYAIRNGKILVFILESNKLKYFTRIERDNSIQDITINNGCLVIGSVFKRFNIEEIEMDFGDQANLNGALSDLSECFKVPNDIKFNTWARFLRLDEKTKNGIYNCFDRVLLEDKIPGYTSYWGSGEKAFHQLHVYEKSDRLDKLDVLRAKAIELYIKENFK